jgi:hypothetical protein
MQNRASIVYSSAVIALSLAWCLESAVLPALFPFGIAKGKWHKGFNSLEIPVKKS